MKNQEIELSEIAFVVYSILIIIMLEIYKEEEDTETFCNSCSEKENFSLEKGKKLPIKTVQDSKQETVAPPKYGFLPRNIWKQAHYGGQSTTPIPGTNNTDPIENSYSQTTTLVLANPYIREEACLPIEGNIGMKIDRAHEIFGPFVRQFII